MRFLPLGLAMATALSFGPPLPAADADAYWVYFGTYTGAKSKGIYRSRFDPKTGSLSKPELAAEVTNPSFVWPHPTNKYLYAVGEVSNLGKKEGGVHAFAMDAKTGELKKLNDMTSGGAGPCHVSVSASGRSAIVANYGGGSCAIFSLTADGALGERIHFAQHVGKSVNPDRQKEPHAHCGYFHPDGVYAYVCDLGLDQVKVYSHDGESTKNSANITLPPGSGPRHLAMTPTADFLFVCGELDSTANVVKMEADGRTGKVIQSVSTLPGGNPVKGNSTAEVVLHPNGKFLYVSNRGHNSIAAFSWDGKELKPVGHATEGIKVPRNFNVTPDGKWMLVASQDGDNVKVFEIDQTTGVPKPTATVVEVGRPVCVKFVPVAK